MRSSVDKKINGQLGNHPDYQRALFSEVEKHFNSAKLLMLMQFDTHSVTQELERGEDAQNLSGTLDGYGNLYSFLGFTSNPIPALRREIDKRSYIDRTVSANGKLLSFACHIPDPSDLNSVGKLPWAFGGSWMSGIEKGIPNFYHFLYDERGNSRSGGGIQVDERLRSSSFSPIPYLTPILEQFKSLLSRI